MTHFSNDDHMEEEVQLKVLVEEEIGETHTRTDQPHIVDDHVDDMKRARTHT